MNEPASQNRRPLASNVEDQSSISPNTVTEPSPAEEFAIIHFEPRKFTVFAIPRSNC